MFPTFLQMNQTFLVITIGTPGAMYLLYCCDRLYEQGMV